jgi:hypothetical protein
MNASALRTAWYIFFFDFSRYRTSLHMICGKVRPFLFSFSRRNLHAPGFCQLPFVRSCNNSSF